MIKKFVIIITFLMIMMMVSSCNPDTGKEQEPNDLREAATRVNPVKNSVIKGKLSTNTDQDYFLFDLSDLPHSFGIMNIKVSGVKGMDMRLSIFKENSTTPLKQANDFMKGDGESLTAIKVRKGEKFILLIDTILTRIDHLDLGEVEKDNPDYPFVDYSDYKIEVELLPFTNTYENEPNDTFKQATELTVGKPMSGYFTPFMELNPEADYIESLGKLSGDYNLYELDLYKIIIPKEIEEDIFVTINLLDVANVNSFLVLFNQDEEILEFVDNRSFNFGEKLLNYTLKNGQTYYVGVMGIHTLKVQKTELYKYTLIVDYLDDDDDKREIEPNDNYENATPVTKGEKHGNIDKRNDDDWYAIVIPEEETYIEEGESVRSFKTKLLAEIKLSGLKDVDLAMDVSKDGTSINYTYDNNGVSEAETISNVTISGLERLYVRVRRSDNDSGNVVNKDNKYILSYRFYYQKENMELEPNDNLNQATPVKLNTPIVGYINPRGDVDNYRIKIDSSRTYAISITTVDGVNLQWQMFEETGLVAQNEKNLDEWDYFVSPKRSHDTYVFKYLEENEWEKELIFRVRDYKTSRSNKYNGNGFNPSQMYTIRIIPRSD
jgi:hypothetical protein